MKPSEFPSSIAALTPAEAATDQDWSASTPSNIEAAVAATGAEWQAGVDARQAVRWIRLPPLSWLALLLLLLAFVFQGSRALYEPDEGRYANVALQMLDSGDWWVPHLSAGEPHLTKPPLTYWTIAASFKAFGRSEWTARLPNALAFVSIGLCVYSIALSLGLRPPWLASAVWATSLGPFVAANVVTTDTLLACFETAAVAAFLRAHYGQGRWRVWLRCMWLAFGLAFLTKGPPGLLPLATLVAWTVWQKPRLDIRQLFEPVGVVLFLLLSFGWFASLVTGHRELVAYFLKYEFVDRIFTDTHDRNSGWGSIVKIYAPALIGGALPWLIPAALRLRRANSYRVGGLDAPKLRLLWLWLLLPLAVFCLARSRMPLYVLPLFVPLALLIARGIAPFWHARRSLLLACLGAWVMALVMLKGVGSHVPSTRNAEQLARQVAHAIHRMQRPADGIAFVAGKPFYGLRLYLDLPIERVGLASGERADGALFDLPDICEEIRTHGHPLWLVQAWRVGEFMERVAACGAEVRALQVGVEGWQSFEVTPSSTAHTSSTTLTGQ